LSEAQSTAVTHNAQELYVAMVQLANHLHQVTHDLHHHQRHRRLGKATTSCSAALAPTKKKIEKKKSSAKSCEHCGRTSSAAWRRGPDYCLYVRTLLLLVLRHHHDHWYLIGAICSDRK
jgi:hypothetical protein